MLMDGSRVFVVAVVSWILWVGFCEFVFFVLILDLRVGVIFGEILICIRESVYFIVIIR